MKQTAVRAHHNIHGVHQTDARVTNQEILLVNLIHLLEEDPHVTHHGVSVNELKSCK